MSKSVSFSLYASIVPLPSVATIAALDILLPAGSLMVAATGSEVPGCHTHKLVGPEGTTDKLSEYASAAKGRPHVPELSVNLRTSWAFILFPLPVRVSTARHGDMGLKLRFAKGSKTCPEELKK